MKHLKMAFVFLLGAVAGAGAWAAGGHHAVDDASILEPGACELEGWFDRSSGGARLLHAGAGCRVGPVELGVAAEHERQSGASQTGYGVGVKWAREVAPGLSIGASAGPAWQARARPRYQGATVALLASWAATDSVNLHANLGRDLLHRATDEARAGVSVDWTFREGWQVMAERYRQEGSHFVRAGLRWEAAKDWTVDLSRANRLSGNGQSSWTLGLTRVFER